MTEKSIRQNNFDKSFNTNCLTPAHFKEILKEWDKMRGGRFKSVDSVLTQVFRDPDYCPDNGRTIDKKYVLLRCYLVDSIYSTQLKEGFNSAVDNISKLGIETSIREGDISVINRIKTVYSTKAKTHQKESLSFASKYCFRINPKDFPIYDSVVKEMLVLINEKKPFYADGITLKDLDSDYAKYKQMACAFISKYDSLFSDNQYNQYSKFDLFDRYLWTWGKKLIQ